MLHVHDMLLYNSKSDKGDSVDISWNWHALDVTVMHMGITSEKNTHTHTHTPPPTHTRYNTWCVSFVVRLIQHSPSLLCLTMLCILTSLVMKLMSVASLQFLV